MVISRQSSRVYFVTVTRNSEETDLDAEQAKLPPYSLERVQVLCNETEQALADNEEKMKVLAEREIPSLRAALKEVNTDMEFSKVMLNTEATAGEKLMLLQGLGAGVQSRRNLRMARCAARVLRGNLSRTGRQRAYTVEQQRFLCLVRAYMQALYAAQV